MLKCVCVCMVLSCLAAASRTVFVVYSDLCCMSGALNLLLLLQSLTLHIFAVEQCSGKGPCPPRGSFRHFHRTISSPPKCSKGAAKKGKNIPLNKFGPGVENLLLRVWCHNSNSQNDDIVKMEVQAIFWQYQDFKISLFATCSSLWIYRSQLLHSTSVWLISPKLKKKWIPVPLVNTVSTSNTSSTSSTSRGYRGVQ